MNNPITPIRRCTAVALIALCAAACTPQEPQGRRGHYPPNTTQKADSQFIRFTDKGQNTGVLETAIVTYEGKRGEKVDLIAAVHVADKGYYERLSRRFSTYDSLLYELVKPKNAMPPRPGRRKRDTSSGMVSYFQRFLRDTLELEFQLDAVDYRAPNFVHADLDAETFKKLSEERGETLLTLMFRAALRAMAQAQSGDSKADPNLGFKMFFALFSEDRARLLKYLLGKELQNMEELLAGLEKGADGKGSVILIERNKALMRVLHKRLDMGDKKIGVFYGGAHLPDVEKRIFAEIGLRRTKVEWQKAWVIERAPAGEDKKEKDAAKKDAAEKGKAPADSGPTGTTRKK